MPNINKNKTYKVRILSAKNAKEEDYNLCVYSSTIFIADAKDMAEAIDKIKKEITNAIKYQNKDYDKEKNVVKLDYKLLEIVL